VEDVSEEIVNGCRNKDTGSQKIVYEVFYQKMYAICLRYADNADEARDLLHDGFIKVFRKIGTFKGDSEFYYWIKRVFNNHCMDYVRSAYKKYLKYEDAHDLHEQIEGYENEDSEHQTEQLEIAQVIELLALLRPDYRSIINMYAIEKMSHEEIARKLGIKEVSSRSKLMRARKQLKKLLDQKKIEQN
jgi:RNA polymerase sigma-70 factor (ECF subfamily)